ncbi:hypothetical protein OU792_07010 [Algoriphagus sp. NF]|uniref:hypothetical protein n=1 Tax=Algoriphagus sp. NF TaxID=2992756 RepID=UPI00237B7100|nr:hypothetical protein [Algoriphagus sp. NF]MDE0559731.1 hypothetical protein [Algoriphagus sp. NF]
MKRLLLIALFLCLSGSIGFAQELQNKLPKNHQAWADRSFPITDTMAFDFPNEGKLLFLFNREEFTPEMLEEEFRPLLEQATQFPAFETHVYRLCQNFSPTSLNRVKKDVEKKYSKWLTSIELGFPVGLDFTAGKFTPEIGFQAALSLPGFQIGGSITNTVYFPESESGFSVNSNWFVNAEYHWKPGSLYANQHQTIQVGYLLNNSNSQLFEGTTMRATYKQTLSRHMSVQAGIVGTKNLTTFYPVVGFRIRF